MQAIKYARFYIPEIELAVAGVGGLAPLLQSYANSQFLFGGLKFTGYRPISELFAETSIAVLPSLSAALDNTIMETMASYTPVNNKRYWCKSRI